MTPTKNRKILDEVRDVMRLHHDSIHTERTYCEWIKRYVQFHGMNSRDDLKKGEKKDGKGAKDRITAFPSSIVPFMQNHLAQVKALHENDLTMWDMAMYTCRMLWSANIGMRHENEAGGMFFPIDSLVKSRHFEKKRGPVIL